MSLNQKLEELGIKNVLVVDDTLENLEAAKKYFGSSPLETSYASNAEQAIQMLAKDKYDLVMTDLEMEKPESGFDVVRKALESIAYATIVTGKNYDRPDNAPHGPNTTVLPAEKSINGKKNRPEVWNFAFGKTLEYILRPEIQETYKSANKYKKYVGKTPEIFVEKMLETYR